MNSVYVDRLIQSWCGDDDDGIDDDDVNDFDDDDFDYNDWFNDSWNYDEMMVLMKITLMKSGDFHHDNSYYNDMVFQDINNNPSQKRKLYSSKS